MIKKITAVLITLTLFLGSISINAIGEETTDIVVDYNQLYNFSENPLLGGYEISGINTSYLDTLKTGDTYPKIDLVFPQQLTKNETAKDVVKISNNAFYNLFGNQKVIVNNIVFDENSKLREIGDNAFYALQMSGDLLLPDSIEYIGANAFTNAGLDGTLKLPKNENYTTISSQLFKGNSLLVGANEIPSSVNIIGKNAFEGNTLAKDFIIPEGVSELHGSVFTSTGIETLSLPSTLTKIAYGAIPSSTLWAQINSTNLEVVGLNGEATTTTFRAESTTIVCINEQIYTTLYEKSSTSTKPKLTYKTTLQFNGTSITRDVLYNQPLNLKLDSGKISWSVDSNFEMPALPEGKTGWSFANTEQQSADNSVEKTSNVIGATLYPVVIINMDYVRSQYEFLELGEYQQVQIAAVEDGSQEQIDAAKIAVDAAKAAGKTVVENKLNDIQTRWYTVEPVIWRMIAETTIDGKMHNVLISEYVLAQKQLNSTAIQSGESELSKWLDTDFSVSVFGDEKINELSISTSLIPFSIISVPDIFPSNKFREAERTDYATLDPIGVSSFANYYWLADGYKDPTYNYGVNELGGYAAFPDTASSGVRPLVTINLEDQILEGAGTFENPYKLVDFRVTDVVIDPTTAMISKGSQQQFNATVNGIGTFDDSVIWTIEGANDPDTKIDNTGKLVVSSTETSTTIVVKATSKADSSKFASANVTVFENGEITYSTNKTNTTSFIYNTLTLPLGIKYYVAVEGMDMLEYTLESSLTLPDNYTVPSKVFIGWLYNEITKTFTAQFVEDKNHDSIPDIYQKTVVYNIVNGSWSNARMQSSNEIVTFYKSGIFSTASDATASLTIPMNPMPNEGYTLGQWSIYVPDTQIRYDNQQLTYTYICKVNTYTVYFEENGGSQIENQSIDFGSKIIEPQNPVKSGYAFIGWYSDQELVNKFDFTTPMPANDITLYAKYSVQDTPPGTGVHSNIQFWISVLGLSVISCVFIGRKHSINRK